MSGRQKHTYPPNDDLAQMIRAQGYVAVAGDLGISPPTLRAHLVREGLPTAMDRDTPKAAQTFTLDNLPEGSDWSPDSLLRKVGLNPEEWRITNVKARGGHWGNPEDPSSQIRLELSVVPVLGGLKLPTVKDWKPLPKPRKRRRQTVKTSVVIGDHHAPHHDKTFHRLFCQWLKDEQPDRIVLNGDLLDFADISRHRQIPATGPGGENPYVNTVNECLQAGFGILMDYRTACPDAQIELKRGNHDERLTYALLDNLKGLYNITAADEDVPALSLRNLLHLDRLHIDEATSEWDKAKTRIGKRLTTLHGYSTGKNPGGKMLNELTGSTLQGHSHRLSLTYRTSHDPDDGPETRLAGECGCACEISGGLGYITAGNPDWQQGAMLVKTWADEDFTVAPIIYLPGRLLLPDGRRYSE